MDDAGLGENVQEQSQAVDRDESPAISNDHTHLDPTRWWFASAAFPMIAGTLGPVASAFSILSLVEKWRQEIPPGSDITQADDLIQDPVWLIAVNAVQLAIAIIANIFLLLNMTRKVRFSIAQPVTIVGWYISAICLVALAATASGPLVPDNDDFEWVWSQAFYYAIYAAVLYFIVASLMVITVWGARAGHYAKDFELTMSQRTLMLQTITFLVYLLVGALIFSRIEGWKYLDGIYWADVTLFTVGYGDYSPSTTLGRALLMPYALVGVTSLGLVIGSIRSLALDRGKRRLDVRMLEMKRRRLIRRITRKGNDGLLEPISGDALDSYPSKKGDDLPQTELERRRKEFALMRKIQAQTSVRRRWTAMAVSTTTWLVLWLVGARIFQACEHPYQGWSYFDGVYFSYTALTTIGYGDIVPISNGGKSFFVFWSLLALPTMTVFISNAGDTIVRIIRDGTLRLGNLTILPGDMGIKKETKQMLAKLSCGIIFEDEDIEELPPGFLGAAQPAETDNDDSDDSKEEDEEDTATPRTHTDGHRNRNGQERAGTDTANRNQKEKPAQKKHRKLASQNFASKEKLDMPVELPKSRPEYHLLLIDEIARVTRHLQSTPPRKYTYKEWAWFLRLIGEDESNAETHQRAMRRPRDEGHHADPGQQPGFSTDDPEQPAEDARVQKVSQWSWIGHRSPLMDSREEADWILDRLEQKLREELQSVVKEKQGEAGVQEVRSEEDSNEQKPLRPAPMQ